MRIILEASLLLELSNWLITEHLQNILPQGQLYLEVIIYKMFAVFRLVLSIISYSIIVTEKQRVIKYLCQILSKTLQNVIFCVLSLAFDWRKSRGMRPVSESNKFEGIISESGLLNQLGLALLLHVCRWAECDWPPSLHSSHNLAIIDAEIWRTAEADQIEHFVCPNYVVQLDPGWQ